MATVTGALDLGALTLVDHHCHGIVLDDLERPAFERLITEGDPPAAEEGAFDSPVGLAIRRWCAPVLGLEPHVPAGRYLERRAELGAPAASRLLLRASGTGTLLLDTGLRPGEILDPAAMGELAGAATRELVRLEAVAEALAAERPPAAEFPDRFAARLRDTVKDAGDGAAGLKSIVAYRLGFDFDPAPPARAEVVAAAGRWLRDLGAVPGAPRVTDPVLLRHGIWAGAELARERGLPLQFHAGFGDTDLDLRRADPLHLTGLIRRFRELGVNLVLLHCYPFHRHAGYLAAAYRNVFFDVGLALSYSGARAAAILAESLELAPFGKLLYSSDAFGLAELYLLGATHFRRALHQVLDGWVASGDCAVPDAAAVAQRIAASNAERLYRLHP
ncbi:MAG TPA: amidohydrolase family protein [Actinomycetota bacterium]